VTAVASPAVDTAELRKARGAFFTPEPIARYVTEWAVRSPTEDVLEVLRPSIGRSGVFAATSCGLYTPEATSSKGGYW
jgi:hypothetical protein